MVKMSFKKSLRKKYFLKTRYVIEENEYMKYESVKMHKAISLENNIFY